MADTGNYVLIAVALSGALLCMGIIHGPAGAYLPERFSTRLRYSGALPETKERDLDRF